MTRADAFIAARAWVIQIALVAIAYLMSGGRP